IVIFGASGDLTYRKLIPALYALYNQQMLPEKLYILGVSRSNISERDFREKLMDGIKKFSENIHLNEQQIEAFILQTSYFQMDMTLPEEYLRLKTVLCEINAKAGTGDNYLFYLSTPPSMFSVISINLAKVGFNTTTDGFKRLIIEKPFGYDLESGRILNNQLHEAFDESQIYRIDHYLGKETVQNLLVMRFSNGIFEPLWNRNYVDHVEITSAESIGVEGRGGYYDGAGALRDMLQNHLLQVVGLTAMEPPSSMDADAIRDETMKVMQSLKPIKEEDVARQVIRGQYMASHVRGEYIPGYREEKGVDPDSRTETFVAMKFYIDNWRWGGVPFYIRTGKRLPTRVTEVVVHFKPTPQRLFQNEESCKSCNQLIIRIQPDEGILLKFGLKQPGTGFNVKAVNMDFHYSELSDIHLPSAYERLIYDAMMGDSTLYARADAVEAAWKFVDPIQRVWSNDPDQKIYGYPAGTWGTENADSLFEDGGNGWRYPCKNLADDGNYCEL
ncbi:MAG: glucose-6-phosphate dehydrogenase, partial [Bacteroidota bacterium]|nr:glucose-6-phosphate dehydrogenase [Bacteroidota bacterium]